MLNQSIIQGNICGDLELRQTPSNVATIKFSVAVSRNFVAKGEERQSDFISVVAWRQTAEHIAKYFEKGSQIIVEGELHTGSYQDKKYPDVKHYTTDLVASNVYFCGKKSDNSSQSQANSSQSSSQFQPQNDGSAALAIGNLSEFEEILGDGQLPF